MPTYEYVCDACNHQFDEFQSFSDKPLKKCPQCKKSKLRRLFGTGAALIFKGSGFYQTDYRSESYKAGAKADAAVDARRIRCFQTGSGYIVHSGQNGHQGRGFATKEDEVRRVKGR